MKSCNRKILDLFYNAKHSGRIIKPDAIGRVGGQDDGLVIELTWRIADDTIIDAKFRAFGNPNAIAITSLMTDYFIGKTLEEVMNIDENVIIDALDELKPEYLEVYEVVCSAIEDAYQYYLKHLDKSNRDINKKQNVKVADLSDAFEIEQDLTQEDIERKIQLSIQHELNAEAGINGTKESGKNIEIGEKRGRGRPRKQTEDSVEETGEKRGRGRPRKQLTQEELAQLQEKANRGRGRPRKERTEEELNALASTEKRGRGRPRKERTEEELAQMQEKVIRGRGRPRKERTEEELNAFASTEKRGRGRPRKERIEIEVIGEKRGRGRPRKESETNEIKEDIRYRKNEPFKINFPKSDLDEIISDEVVEQLISGSNSEKEIKQNNLGNDIILDIDKAENTITTYNNYFEDSSSNDFELNSNLEPRVSENIIDDAEIEESEKRGRGRPRKERIQIEVIGEKRPRGRPRKELDEQVEVGEKRGRGRPKKEVEESIEDLGEKRGRGRPKKEETTSTMASPINSLTRSLASHIAPNFHNTQDIVFASKNVTTTNININVTKTTNSNGETNNEYSKNINITSTTEDALMSNSVKTNLQENDAEKLEEVDVESNTQQMVNDEIDVSADGIIEEVKSNSSNLNKFKDVEDDEEESFEEYDEDEYIEDSHIKDEAPKGGIEDLLRALLDD